MGNKLTAEKKPDPTLAPSTFIGRAFHEFENRSGKMLVRAIKANSKQAVDEAVEYARREFIKPRTRGVSNDADYNDMNEGLTRYLTQDTDIGEGSLFTQTPLRFATSCKSDIAAAAIQEHLDRLHLLNRKDGSRTKVSMTVGEVNASRAELAKERLKAFQANK